MKELSTFDEFDFLKKLFDWLLSTFTLPSAWFFDFHRKKKDEWKVKESDGSVPDVFLIRLPHGAAFKIILKLLI